MKRKVWRTDKRTTSLHRTKENRTNWHKCEAVNSKHLTNDMSNHKRLKHAVNMRQALTGNSVIRDGASPVTERKNMLTFMPNCVIRKPARSDNLRLSSGNIKYGETIM